MDIEMPYKEYYVNPAFANNLFYFLCNIKRGIIQNWMANVVFKVLKKIQQ